MTCTSGCNYSLCTPDDGCGIHQKHVEWLGSKVNKDSFELHLFGFLKHKNTVALLVASKKAGLEVNAEKSKYTV
jgi:hypothetical protein